jgi:hypothetical protein
MDRRKFLSLASFAGLSVASLDAFGRPSGALSNGKTPLRGLQGPVVHHDQRQRRLGPHLAVRPQGRRQRHGRPDAMNRSYLTANIGTTPSGIRYAPLGSQDNPDYFKYFFEKHDKELLVINGVDMPPTAMTPARATPGPAASPRATRASPPWSPPSTAATCR